MQLHDLQLPKNLQPSVKVLNQMRTGHMPARTRFLEIDLVCKVCRCLCVSVSTPEANNN